ncbi:MAG: Holliday junction resolvase RuvX [Dehalococcoidales bacterium]|nr:Holliday junction resolvase RuvX [Dehalococcoidales bacterium]MDP6632393.1 Holliday junction resolvase RuvX [Dehalococcoidales bacterium]
MGLDIGDRRIGVALSDPGGILASPHTIINRDDDKQAIEAIIDIADQQQVGQIIAGIPLSVDGTVGVQAEKVKDFVESLSCRTQIPIEFRDERLTTLEAKRIMLISRSRKNRRKSRDDAVAAAVILQSYLEERL